LILLTRDMKRPLLICAVISLCGSVWSQSVPLGEIVREDRSIRDSLYGVSARYPAGWAVRGVTRWGVQETTIFFGAPAMSAFSTLYYRAYSQPMPLAGRAEDVLREEARKKAEQRVVGGLADYTNLVNSFEFKTIAGHPALSNAARFTGGGGRTLYEYFVRIISAQGIALFVLRAPLEEFEALRPAFDAMVESLHLP
jgi:hypothetical protein